MTLDLSQLESAVTNYDPDHDIATTGGSGGINLAEAIFKTTGGKPEIFKEVVTRSGRINYLSLLINIANRRVKGHAKTRGLHAIFFDLRKAGYNVPSYGCLNSKKSKELLSKIRGEVSTELEDLNYRQFSFR